ncbi:hypothetical protein [Peribacillus glennii]|uniref:Uncharacterized protein n=1 Tax=Peribacillus glennii TaxID=2303991 RepID=A0A372LIJ1_9BACI|nr:hypothetical protein [Peribacillus glennii]RFU65456.1 hypothetical protein D0466_06090 [Peribacillus glennii]
MAYSAIRNHIPFKHPLMVPFVFFTVLLFYSGFCAKAADIKIVMYNGKKRGTATKLPSLAVLTIL